MSQLVLGIEFVTGIALIIHAFLLAFVWHTITHIRALSVLAVLVVDFVLVAYTHFG